MGSTCVGNSLCKVMRSFKLHNKISDLEEIQFTGHLKTSGEKKRKEVNVNGDKDPGIIQHTLREGGTIECSK